jgi:hypothetical protein
MQRDDWYEAQPPGTSLDNRQYRRAMGLPLGYLKASYSWCLDQGWEQLNSIQRKSTHINILSKSH